MMPRSLYLCQRTELIQRLLDAAEQTYLMLPPDRTRLHRLLDLAEKLQRRHLRTKTPRRRYKH